MARDAITFSAGDPESVVTASVVRVIAADSGPASDQRAGERGGQPGRVAHQRPQRVPGRAGPAGASASGWAAAGSGGTGARSRRVIARAIRAVGPSFCGVEAWPPRPSTESSSDVTPFSVTPMTATGTPMPGNAPVRHGAALVEDEPGPDAAPGQLLDREPRGRAGDLLVAAEREPDVLGRLEAVGEQPLHGLADADQAALVVEGAATPDLAVDDLGAEGGALPRRASRRPAPRRGAPSARPACVAARPRQWKSRAWVWIRVSSRRSCTSGNWRASSSRKASKTAVSVRAGSRCETVGIRTSAWSLATAASGMGRR